MEKSDGGFWVTSSDGVALYNASDNSFTTFKAEEVGLTAPVNLYGIAVNGVDDVWFGSTGVMWLIITVMIFNCLPRLRG